MVLLFSCVMFAGLADFAAGFAICNRSRQESSADK